MPGPNGELNPSCITPYPLTEGLNQIKIPLAKVNDSLQVGDDIFIIYSNQSSVINNMNTSLLSPTKVGVLAGFQDDGIILEFNNCATCPCAPITEDYLMFAKNKSVNTSGLKGYYLEAEFVNNSPDYAELFSVGTEFAESSK